MIDLKGIKNIIFDFGDVIIDIDHSLPEKEFRKLGLNNFEDLYSQDIQNDLFDKLEKGLIKPQKFREEIRRNIKTEVSDEVIDEAWNSIILDIPAERIRVLEKLKPLYQTFLLSNTNKIHYDQYLADLQRVYRYNSFNDLFKKAYFSFEMGMQKPHCEIFEFVLNENKLVPEETLFIDDTLRHVEGAAKLGIKTFFLEKGMDIVRLFEQ